MKISNPQSKDQEPNSEMLQGTIGFLEVIKWLTVIISIGSINPIGPMAIVFAVSIALSITVSQGILRILSRIEKHLRDIKKHLL